MTFMEFVAHPVTQALIDGAKYTGPKVFAAMRENMMAKPVTEQDIQQAAAGTIEPDSSEIIEEVKS